MIQASEIIPNCGRRRTAKKQIHEITRNSTKRSCVLLSPQDI
jgi:hypothetical protein